jgi:hypothetical protein
LVGVGTVVGVVELLDGTVLVAVSVGTATTVCVTVLLAPAVDPEPLPAHPANEMATHANHVAPRPRVPRWIIAECLPLIDTRPGLHSACT